MMWSPTLDVIFASLFIVRVLAFIALAFITLRTTKDYLGWKAHANEIKSLFTFGSWITVSNIISPVMVYFDRFYIATVLSASVVAYYTTPVDFLTKSMAIPFALIAVMFASFATDWQRNNDRAFRNYRRTTIIVAGIMFPTVCLMYTFAHEGMSLWLGTEFANNSYHIVQIISIGLFFNAMAMIPFALIQASGRADITAKFHIFELPFYVVLLWYFTNQYGLIGAAYTWTIRAALDCALLYTYITLNINKTKSQKKP